MDKEAIKRNFSKYARYYDKYSTVQGLCAEKLISTVEDNGFSRILDIGCGTGKYTKLLKKKFPLALITAVDISKEMIEIAKKKFKNERIEFIVADGEEIDFKEEFDFISSNATFQWFENLDKTLLRYRGHLKKDGVISFSTFGPLTFYELNISLRRLFGKNISIASCNFIESESIRKALKCYFKAVEINEEIYKEKYDSLADLLIKIKYTGTRGNGANGRSFWTPEIIEKLEDIYRKEYKDILATYQVFLCRGIK